MKLMKKIVSVMLTLMMVLGMSSMVGAADTAASANDGTITINNAVAGQTYKIYKILDLESSNGNNYAYKTIAGSSWETFVEGGNINGTYVSVDSDDYVKWKDGADVKKFAEEALKYAQQNNVQTDNTATAASETVEFKGLPLGYYLVESSMGTLCSLTTNSPNVTINEKNAAPTVDKEVKEDSKDRYQDKNTADIGQIVEFQTTINVQDGAKNYVLHDKMSTGLTYIGVTSVKLNGSDVAASNYEVKTSGLETADPCTFHIEFTQAFCDTLTSGQQIAVSYTAKVNENAVIGSTGNENKAWLNYGENSKTTESTTVTRTYEIPVFKYKKISDNNKEGLGGAVFKLCRDAAGKNTITLVKTSAAGAEDLVYRVAMEGEQGVTEITTPASGNFKIQGLDADTYYLVETTAPAGYNKLSGAVKVVINEDGEITVDGSQVTATVEIENKTGSILPSTGGMGTKLFYIIGAVLVLGSGVVLITKKRMK